jgi:uncharacterized membrane protein
MSHGETPELGAGGGREVERLVYFSDAVMAIAMTLLVIDLRLPESITEAASDADLRRALEELGPQFLSVALSFAVIAIWWNGHHRLFRTLARSDGLIVLLNFVFLAAIAFLPFPTALIGRFVDHPTAVALYAATNVVAGSAILAMRWHADRRGLISAESPIERQRRLAMASLAPIAFALTIPLAFVDSTLAALSWTLMIPAVGVVRWWFARAERREAAAEGDAAEGAPPAAADAPPAAADAPGAGTDSPGQSERA